MLVCMETIGGLGVGVGEVDADIDIGVEKFLEIG